MAMTTAKTASANATASDQISRITRGEFIQQGIDIVHAYANDCRLNIVFPEHSPAQLAQWIWSRRADKNGTIPLLPRHIAVRLPDGRLRIMDRNSENKPAFPVPDTALDVIDSYRPVVPPDVDEAHPLPAPFLRSKHDGPEDTEASFDEDYDFPENGFPLDKFPSPPPDTRSPPILPIRNLEPSESLDTLEPGSPEMDIAYPLRKACAVGHDENCGQKAISRRQLEKMLEQVRSKRRRIKRMLDDSQAELAQAVLELQKARNDLTFSVADSRRTLERLKQLFGTKRTLQVLDVIQRGREGRFRSSDFITTDLPQIPSEDGSSLYDDESTDSRPDTRSTRASKPAINENTIVPNNVTVPAVSTPANGAATITNQETNERAREVAAVLPSRAMSITRVTSQTRDNTMGGSNQEARESTTVRSSQDMAVAEDPVSHLLVSGSGRSSRKRNRDENDDSETEVERSVLYDIRSGSSKRRRFNSTGAPRSGSKTPAGNGDAGTQRSAQRPRPGDIPKDRRPKREHAVFLSTPSPFRLRHIQDKIKSARMITHLGLDETERHSSPPPQPEDQTRLTPPRRPLRRSASRIISYADGGYLYVKH